MSEAAYNYHKTNPSEGLRIVDDGRNRKQVQISLSEAQAEALDNAAKQAGKNRSEFVRDLLADAIDNFPDDLAGQGKYDRTPKN